MVTLAVIVGISLLHFGLHLACGCGFGGVGQAANVVFFVLAVACQMGVGLV